MPALHGAGIGVWRALEAPPFRRHIALNTVEAGRHGHASRPLAPRREPMLNPPRIRARGRIVRTAAANHKTFCHAIDRDKTHPPEGKDSMVNRVFRAALLSMAACGLALAAHAQ
ncbi:hypothetical protein GBZ26_11910, partial [Azospirillum formosense]|nr:hypothetical protein [Azospirillum formosense]